jgi:branched-chain amino acid transport system permease protein
MLLFALLAAMAFSAALNFGIDRIAYRRLRNAPRLAPLIAAIGVSFILQNIAIYWKGPNNPPQTPLFPGKLPSRYTYNVLEEWFGIETDIKIGVRDVAVIAISIVLLVALSWFVYRTRIGKAMRATAQDREAAALMGIDINQTIGVAFLLGGALAGAGGMIAAYYNDTTKFDMGFRYGLFAFTAAVLGGIGNLAGTVIGAFCIGIVWAFSDGFMRDYVSGWGSQWTTTVIFGLLVLVMIFRPSGLFGELTGEKA